MRDEWDVEDERDDAMGSTDNYWGKRQKQREYDEQHASRWGNYGESFWEKEGSPIEFPDHVLEKAKRMGSDFEAAFHRFIRTYFGEMGARIVHRFTYVEAFVNGRLSFLAGYHLGRQDALHAQYDEVHQQTGRMIVAMLDSAVKGETGEAGAIRMMAASRGCDVPEEALDQFVGRVDKAVACLNDFDGEE